jgi:hypothetical protein
MRATWCGLLLGLSAASAACGGDNASITIHAPDQTVAVFENDRWTPIRMTDGVGELTPEGPFALAAVCGRLAQEGDLGGVHVVLGGPGDVTETRSRCRPRPRDVDGQVDIVGTSNAVQLHVGERVSWVQGTGPSSLPPGRHDIVAFDSFSGRYAILHDVSVTEGFAIRLDFSSPAHMAERRGGSYFILETKNGTVVYGYVPGSSIAADELVDGDRQSVIRMLSEPDPFEQHAFVRLDAGRDNPLGGVPVWTPPTVGDVRVRGAGGRIEAQWTSDAAWTTRTVTANVAGVRWHVEAHDGWDDGSATELRTPDLATHPAWDDAFSVRRGTQATLELSERFDARSEGVVSAPLVLEDLP